MVSSGTECHTCGEMVDGGSQAVRAFSRVVIAPDSDEIPDARGTEALFHQQCAPDWGDPEWISRAEGAPPGTDARSLTVSDPVASLRSAAARGVALSIRSLTLPAGVRVMRQVFEQVELCDDAGGAFPADRHER